MKLDKDIKHKIEENIKDEIDTYLFIKNFTKEGVSNILKEVEEIQK